jgi:hypothetical protein
VGVGVLVGVFVALGFGVAVCAGVLALACAEESPDCRLDKITLTELQTKIRMIRAVASIGSGLLFTKKSHFFGCDR